MGDDGITLLLVTTDGSISIHVPRMGDDHAAGSENY